MPGHVMVQDLSYSSHERAMNRSTFLHLSAALGAILFASCSESPTTIPPADSSRSHGAVKLPLSGRILRLGAVETTHSAEESPGWTRFSTDIWMDTTEVTQSEFQSLLGRNPSSVPSTIRPVTDVTWYDAVLAANARSRRDGLDSVYAYADVRRDSSGGATMLLELTIDPTKSGWRLPTEAEWEAAARCGTTTTWPWGNGEDSLAALEFSWFSANSEGRSHDVATRLPNAWGLHDMSGNVMEWVNDWKGAFPKDTLEGFSGGQLPSDIPEVPIKGGSFVHGMGSLRPSSRSGTYPAFRSSKTNYVGFRLARGGYHPRYLDPSGQVIDVPPVELLRKDVLSLLEVREARLVFLNRNGGRGFLSWVDFGESAPVVRTLPDPDPVFHPAISPDGRWVVWSTALEGSTGASRIKARRLSRNDTVVLDLGEGAIPRWSTEGRDTFLVWSSAMDNTDPGWPMQITVARKWSVGGFAGPATTLSAGAFHDGRSGSYLFTGYRRLKRVDLRNGEMRTLFAKPLNGKPAEDTSQVCNVSAAPDSTGRVLFLDFGYNGTSTVVGRPYGIHEIGFVADSTGKVVQTLEAPIGERQWEHLEWSNHSRWAVSGAIDASGSNGNLYLLDLDSNRSTKIASGKELWQPAIWLGQKTTAAVDVGLRDSAANYGVGEIQLRGSQFWTRHSNIDAVFLGSSHTATGILPAQMVNVRGFIFGFAGSSPYDQTELMNRYVLPHSPGLKVVCIAVMPGWLFEPVKNLSRAQWLWLEASPGYVYDRDHLFWKDGIPPGFVEAAAKRVRETGLLGAYDSSGAFLYRTLQTGWSGEFSTSSPILGQTAGNPDYQQNLEILEDLVKELSGKGLKVVLIKFPESPEYGQQSCATRYGPDSSLYRQTMDRFRSWEATYAGVRFYDAHQDGRHDYLDSEAMNSDHLNLAGAAKFTKRLDSLIGAMYKVP